MNELNRREFFSNAWKVGFGLLAAAGAWTSWDLLQPRLAAGFGAVIRSVSPDAVPANTVLPIPQARAYLTKIGDEVVAFSEVCSHLGCRVPFIDETGLFECPCHGSTFTREGDYISGPAPRGMDRYDVEVVEGIIEIDTSQLRDGPAPGTGSS